MTTHLTICLTCQKNTGTELYNIMTELGTPDGVKITGFDCLWSCSSACSVQIQAAGKCGYHLGGFTAVEDHAAALIDFAGKYHRSPTGEVSFDLWPDAIKGHFMARIAPLVQD